MTTVKSYTKEERKEMVRQAEKKMDEGMSALSVAKELGVSDYSIRAWGRKYGTKNYSASKNRFSDEKQRELFAELESLVSQGLSIREASVKLEVGVSNYARWRNKFNSQYNAKGTSCLRADDIEMTELSAEEIEKATTVTHWHTDVMKRIENLSVGSGFRVTLQKPHKTFNTVIRAQVLKSNPNYKIKVLRGDTESRIWNILKVEK